MSAATDPSSVSFRPLKLIDTTFRDGNQSLLGGRLRASEILPIARKMDNLGFLAIEAFGGGIFESWLRLGEEPWEYLRQLRQVLPNTPIQAVIRGQNLVGDHHFSDDTVELFIRHAANCGVDIFRIFDPLNDLRNIEMAVAVAHQAKRRVQGALCYAISPAHNLNLWCTLAKQLADLEVDELVIKDTSGLLTPQTAWELVTVLSQASNLPVIVHSHCSSGMAPMAYMAAVEAGAHAVDTALSPLAWGSSQPATESIVAALRGSEYDPGLELSRLAEIGEELETVLQHHQEDRSPLADRIDSEVLHYQLPGVMIQDIHRQLAERQASESLRAALEEVALIRKELGYPPLVAPIRQWIADQAVYNVLSDSRYKTIVQELKAYLQGLSGRPPKTPASRLRQLVLGRGTPITVRPADLLESQVEQRREERKRRKLANDDGALLEELLFPQLIAERRRAKATAKPVKSEKKETPAPKDRTSIETPSPQGGGIVEAAPPSEPVSNPGTEVEVEVEGEIFTVRINGPGFTISPSPGAAAPTANNSPKKPNSGPGSILAPMQGLIVKVSVAVGDQVKAGDVVAVLEAMKMQNDITAPKAGQISEIYVEDGQVVSPNQPLLRIGE